MNYNIKLLIESIFTDNEDLFNSDLDLGVNLAIESQTRRFTDLSNKLTDLGYIIKRENTVQYNHDNYERLEYVYENINLFTTILDKINKRIHDSYYQIDLIEQEDNIITINISRDDKKSKQYTIITLKIDYKENIIDTIIFTDYNLIYDVHAYMSPLLEEFKINNIILRLSSNYFNFASTNQFILSYNYINTLFNHNIIFEDFSTHKRMKVNNITYIFGIEQFTNKSAFMTYLDSLMELGIKKFKYNTKQPYSNIVLCDHMLNPGSKRIDGNEVLKQYCIDNNCIFVLTKKEQQQFLKQYISVYFFNSKNIPLYNSSISMIWSLTEVGVSTDNKGTYRRYKINIEGYNSNEQYKRYYCYCKFYTTSEIVFTELKEQ